MIPILTAIGCGGGGSSDSGSLNFGAVWEQPGKATPGPGTPGATPGQGGEGAFGTALPPSVTTVRIVFDSPALRCCVAIQPSKIPPDPDTGRRQVVLQPLPTGPATISIVGYPSLTAPAPSGAPSSVCPTQPTGVGDACVPGGTDTPSFESDPTPLTIEPGAVTDVGEVPVRSVPFVIAPSRSPAPDSVAPSPVEIAFVVADAVSGVDASSVRAQITDALGVTSGATLNLSPCDDRGDVLCSAGGALDVRGQRVVTDARSFPAGTTAVRVLARNLAAPAESVDTQWKFRAAPALPTPSSTLPPSATATAPATSTATSSPRPTSTATLTARPSSTPVPTNTATASPRPSPTATGSPTTTASPRPTPTGTETRTASATPTRTPSPSPTGTPTVTRTRTVSPTVPPCAEDAPQNECATGTRLSRHACELEWLFAPPPDVDTAGMRLRSISCHDGDATCDVDGKVDNQCTFRVSLCINNMDPRLSRCSPSQLDTFEVREPNPNSTRDAADANNVSQLEGAAKRPGGFGVTVLRGGAPFSPGVANDTLNLCSGPLDMLVPLAGDPLAAATRRLRLRISNSVETTNLSMRMTCLPPGAQAAQGAGGAEGNPR